MKTTTWDHRSSWSRGYKSINCMTLLESWVIMKGLLNNKV